MHIRTLHKFKQKYQILVNTVKYVWHKMHVCMSSGGLLCIKIAVNGQDQPIWNRTVSPIRANSNFCCKGCESIMNLCLTGKLTANCISKWKLWPIYLNYCSQSYNGLCKTRNSEQSNISKQRQIAGSWKSLPPGPTTSAPPWRSLRRCSSLAKASAACCSRWTNFSMSSRQWSSSFCTKLLKPVYMKAEQVLLAVAI